MAAQIDAAIAMRRIAMPERPNGGRVPRQGGERLARTSDVCRGGRAGGVCLEMPCRWPGQVGHRAILAPIGGFHRDCGRQSAASGASRNPVTLQNRHFQAQPSANTQLPQFESLRQAPSVAFSRSCDSPNAWLAEAEFVLGSCDSVWPRAVVQRGRGRPPTYASCQNSSLRVLRLNCMVAAG
jgi:hypothetical protein